MDQLRIYMIYFFSLKSLYFSQYNRKWDAVSTSLLWQSEHSLASLGSLFCLWRPVSMARLCPLSLSVFSLVFYQSRWSGTLPPCTLSLGSNTILIYFVIRWFGSSIWYHLLVVLRWLSWARLFGVCPEALVCEGRASGPAGRGDSYLCSTLGTEGLCTGRSGGR